MLPQARTLLDVEGLHAGWTAFATGWAKSKVGDFANELCEDAPAETSDAGEVDVPMDGGNDPPQEEIEAEARRFLESMKKTRGK